MTTFRKKYFIASLVLFITEVLIAIFFHGGFVRNYIGDFLVIIFIYCVVRTFFKIPVIATALGVLIFSYVIEFSQHFNLVKHLGFEKYAIAKIILGNSFEWLDIIAYSLGIVTVIAIERVIQWKRSYHKK